MTRKFIQSLDQGELDELDELDPKHTSSCSLVNELIENPCI